MNRIETTYCKRCNAPFECKANDINKCQCNSIVLSKEIEAVIKKLYNGCLCIKCLTELNNTKQL